MKLNIKQTQQQRISQKMLLSNKILQLNALGVEEYLEELSWDNPVLVIDAAEEPEGDVSESAIRTQEWLTANDYQNRDYFRYDSADSVLDTPLYEKNQNEESLEDFLRFQLLDRSLKEEEKEILEFLIDSLDEHGYMRESAEELAACMNASPETVKNMLEMLRTFEPAGVGAGSPVESLIIQIQRKCAVKGNDRVFLIAERLLRECPELLAKQHVQAICGKLEIREEEYKQAIELIAGLTPHPASGFKSFEETVYIIPDVIFAEETNQTSIVVRGFDTTRIRADEYYTGLLQETEDLEAKHYLEQKYRQIEQIRDALRMRESTLSKIVKVIAAEQNEFFLYGPARIRPMSLVSVAEQVGLHISTVSRAMSSKYLQCKWGVFPLNYFLSRQVGGNEQNGTDVSVEQVYQMIRELVEAEDPRNPLSDEKIADALKKRGVNISRRTVNKYRSKIGIPDKTARKTPFFS